MWDSSYRSPRPNKCDIMSGLLRFIIFPGLPSIIELNYLPGSVRDGLSGPEAKLLNPLTGGQTYVWLWPDASKGWVKLISS